MKKESVGDFRAAEADWKFQGSMVKHFQKHISKSIPLYTEGHQLICSLSDYFLKENSVCVDLGTSTGVLPAKLSEKQQKRGCRIIGIDIEKDMIREAEKKHKSERIEFVCADINEFGIPVSDMIISYYTIQFIHPSLRGKLIKRIYEKLNPGGAFILFEKVRAEDPAFQDYMRTLYEDFKLDQGFHGDEIISKTRSLKGILKPLSEKENFIMIENAGFKKQMTIMKYISFTGILAVK